MLREVNWQLVFFSLVLALAASIVPWPRPIAMLQPEWVLLLLIYWSTISPSLVGVGVAWLVGLFQDSLTGAVLGEHALAAAIVVYFSIQLRLRFRIFPVWQQAFCVMLMVACAKVLLFWIEGLLGRQPTTWQYWLPMVSSFLVWPVLQNVLDNVVNRRAVLRGTSGTKKG